MNLIKAQEVIEDLEAVCKKHNIALVGGSVKHDSYFNIIIFEVDDLSRDEIDHLSSGDSPYIVDGLTVVNGIC